MEFGSSGVSFNVSEHPRHLKIQQNSQMYPKKEKKKLGKVAYGLCGEEFVN